MPDETIIQQVENIFSEVIKLGGQNERTRIVPNLLVRDASPSGLDGFVIVADDRDSDNILAKKVGSIIYSTNDLVNVIFPEGGEAIAFQQGSQSPNAGIWEIVPGTSTDIYYNKGKVGIGTDEIPHEGVGVAKFAIDGTDLNASLGPHIQITTGADDYPVFQQLNFSHDNVSLNFDSYFDAATIWRSSDTGSNFQIHKVLDSLRINYDSGVAQGGAITWNDGIVMDSAGNVGIRTSTPDASFQVGDGAPTIAPGTVFNTVLVGPDTLTGRLMLEGTGQADIIMVDAGAGANDKVMQLVTDGGTTKFLSLTDVGGVTSNNILVMDHGTGYVGMGTATPDYSLQIGDGASAVSLAAGENILFVGPDTASGRLILEGTAQADLYLIDAGAGANDKAMQLITDGGTTKFRAMSDAAGLQTDNIVVMDHGTGGVGMGTATIPHGSVGAAKLALDGTNANFSTGPHIQTTTTTDDYPLIQILSYGHDDIYIQFDAYSDAAIGSSKSSDSGSNFAIAKTTNKLLFLYDAGIAQGAAITWNDGITMNNVGAVVINEGGNTGGDLRVEGDTEDHLFFVDAGNEKIGINTATIPHGSIGHAKLAMDGDNASATDGPHIQITTASDDYPLLQMLNFTHDNISIAFDSYFESTQWESSDTGSNFQLYKLLDVFRIRYDSGVIPGGTITWNEGISLDTSGQVGIGISNPSTRLDIDAGAMEFAEMTAPAAGAANTARLFAQDNGAGKTQLAVRFNTGAIQILATEP